MSDYLATSILLDLLLNETWHPQANRPYTLREVAEGTGVNYNTLKKIRQGDTSNPGLDTLRALCLFFHVEMNYFEARTQDEALAMIAQGRGSTTQSEQIALRIAQLSPDAQADILKMLNWVQQAEWALDRGAPLPSTPTKRDETGIEDDETSH